ncbi:MAG TPA: sulfatase [Solirubrobacterales bacterium]|nr:sulfatase [Solirubrobacterales bacterium]
MASLVSIPERRGITTTTPPNILYIHSHDTGRCVQPYGFQVPTPNIQLLADQGVLFREAFCAAPTCSGSRASLLTGLYCHNNGMLGLAHRGWKLNDYRQHWVHTLRRAGYHSTLIGEQHVSVDPEVIGYDEVVPVDSNHAEFVAPLTIEALREAPAEPWFMSVGFFETHRSFFAPTSVRDTLYSLPPGNLPDVEATRRDMAAFKASARSLDQGIGAVLHALHDCDLVDDTLVLCTTDHGVAFPNAKATLFDPGIGVLMIVRGPGGFTGGKVVDAPVTHLDVFPTLCELAGVEQPPWLQGSSLMPLVRGETDRLHDAIFAETTYHAAYQPHRAVRTERWKYIKRFDDYPHPVLANCDDSESKELLVAAGWGEQEVPVEQLYDLVLDPSEGHNLAGDPARVEVLAEMRGRLDRWMRETDDPLLAGPVAPPPGATVNEQWQVSPDDPVRIVTADPTASPSS